MFDINMSSTRSNDSSMTHTASLWATRNLLNQQAAAGGAPDPERELAALSGGQVADMVELAKLSSLSSSSTVSTVYDPIDPFVINDGQLPPAPEMGRLQTRLYSLQAKLAAASSPTD